MDDTTPRHRSRYLVNESPIPLYRSLAVALGGSDRALILQQLNYKLAGSGNVIDGRHWIYRTYQEWQDDFPWLSLSTVRRILDYLEGAGLVLTGSYNKHKTDRTKWYTIDDEAIGRFLERAPSATSTVPTAQNEQTRAAQDGSIDRSNEGKSGPDTPKEEAEETDERYIIRMGHARGYTSAEARALGERYTWAGKLQRARFLDALKRR